MADPARTEAEIIEACRTGAPGAAEAFVLRYEQAVWRVAGRLVGRWDAAEDIVQETFVRAFLHMHEIDAHRGAQAWLLRAAVNLGRDYARHSARREIPEPIDENVEPIFSATASDPERTAHRHELKRRLERALGALSVKLREIVVLHYIEGIPLPEVRRILGVPLPALKMRALRARARLRALLAEEP